MSNLLNFLQELGINPRRTSVADGCEYSSPCPSCGDGGKGRASDRFHIWPGRQNKNGLCAGRFWCRQCGISGDTIEFLIKFHNMDFPSACAHLGIKLEGNGRTGYHLPKTPVPPKDEVFEPREYPLPTPAWSTRAAAFLADCHDRLLNTPEALEWLEKRGIGRSAVLEYRLGYNESSRCGDRYRPRSLWGLPEKEVDGKARKLWLPRGWVIPAFTRDGSIYQLRIRRRDDDIARFASDIKYLRVEGSSDAAMILHPNAPAHVVVECGFDAILLAGLFSGRLGAVTTWNSSARPDVRAHEVLSQSHCILNALDFDKAGTREQGWWRDTYPQNRRWPVPVGKDPGDAWAAGVDLREWLLAGLPVALVDQVARMEKPVAEKVARKTAAEELESREIRHRILTLADGRECHITDSPEVWDELTAEGKVVFSEEELMRLQEACRTMSAREREQAALLTVDIKEIFGGRISRGELLA